MKAKQLAIAIPVIAIAFALTVSAAFARDNKHNDDRCGNDRDHRCDQPEPQPEPTKMEVDVNSENQACVTNNVGAVSNSGMNMANRNEGHGTVMTGKANAWAEADTTANGNETRITVMDYDRLKVNTNSQNNAHVGNNVGAISNSGLNTASYNGVDDEKVEPNQTYRRDKHCGHRNRCHQDNDDDDEEDVDGNGYIETGEAWSTAQAVTMLNTNFTKID